jgi:hypothetical protein
MATWTTELGARVEVDEELKGALMAALVAAFPEPKPALVFGHGRLRARLEVEADYELEAARLAVDRFAKALEKAILELLPRGERLEKRRLRRRKSGSSGRPRPPVAGPAESCS